MVERENRYPLLVGKHFNWEVVDKAIPGSCNSKIIRCAMRDCINLLSQNQPMVALIQLTHRERFEYAGTPDKNNYWKYGLSLDQTHCDPAVDDQFESIKPMDENSWPKEIVSYAKQYFTLQKISALNTNILHSVIGLAAFFQTNNIKYFIYTGPSYNYKNHSNDMLANPFYQYLLKDPGVLDLYNFNMLDLTGKLGHPDLDGMQAIADYFINQLDEPA
jgi:hypothetical protein